MAAETPTYKFSDYDKLKPVLIEKGWKPKSYFGPSNVQRYFSKEIDMSATDLADLTAKLNEAKSDFEEAALLNALARGVLKDDIGKTYEFANLRQLCDALDQRRVRYPKSYLEQTQGSFAINFQGRRHLSREDYNSMIEKLTAITGHTEQDDLDRGEIIRAAFKEKTLAALTAPVAASAPVAAREGASGDPRTVVETPYPSKQKAFEQAFLQAKSFPFIVQYSEGGTSYEVQVSAAYNSVNIGERKFVISHDSATIAGIRMDSANVYMKGTYMGISGEKSMSKADFVANILPRLMGLGEGTHPLNFAGQAVKIDVLGSEEPKKIDTPTQSVDKGLIERIRAIKKQLSEKLKDPLTPLDLKADFDYFNENLKDPLAKQMAMNWIMNKLLDNGYIVQIMEGGMINVTPNEAKGGTRELASGFESSLNSSMNANYFTRASLEESIIMMSGQKWSDYARTLAKPEQASADGYAAYLLDIYTEPQRGKLTGKALADYVAMHKTMKPEEKAFLLSHLSGQMRSVNVGQVAKNYSEIVANFTEFQSSAFFSIANAITGGRPLTPAETQAAAEAAARGSNGEGGDGKPMTWMLGIVGAFVGLGFKKGEGWSLWTSLKRIFMGGLAIGGVMLGCAAAREWKKELDMDVCGEAKKALKDAWKDLKGETTDAAAAPASGAAAAPAGQAQGPATGPATLSQQAAENDKTGVKADTRLLALIDAKKTHPTTNGTIDHYIAFARTLKDTPLQTLVAPNNNPQMGIFGDSGLDPAISNNIPANLDKTLLKDFLRRYLTGQSIRTSALKPAGASWDDYKSKFDTSKTLGDEIQKTYIQNAPAQSNNTGAATVDENTLKSYTVTGASIDSSKTNVVKNPDGTFILSYSLSNLGIFVPDGPLSINLDKTGAVTSPTIKLRGKAGPLGTAEKLITVSKNNSTINLQIG